MKRGDVVLIVAPGELGKPRPAVVVQADELGDETTAVVVCPMSTDIRQFERVRPVVSPSAMTGVRVPSQIMTDKIVALPRTRIRRVVGRLDLPARQMLDQALLFVLGLAV